MTVQEIKKRAQAMGIKPGKMKKAEMIRVIQTTEGNHPCFQTADNTCDQSDCCWRSDCLTTK